MVLGQDLQGLLLVAVADEPPGRFGKEPDPDSLQNGGEGLEDAGDAPGPGAVEAKGAKGDPGRDDRPATILSVGEGGRCRAMAGVGELSLLFGW